MHAEVVTFSRRKLQQISVSELMVFSTKRYIRVKLYAQHQEPAITVAWNLLLKERMHKICMYSVGYLRLCEV